MSLVVLSTSGRSAQWCPDVPDVPEWQGRSIALLMTGLGVSEEAHGAWPSWDRTTSTSEGPC